MIVDYCHLSEVGPRARNEDSLGIWLESPKVAMAAIADGLGGLQGGADASQLAISEIERLIALGDLPSNDLHKVFSELHEEIIQAQKRSAENRAMATTLSFIQVEEGGLKGAHVGDTRVMVARRNGIKRLTHDQTEAWRLLQGGLLIALTTEHTRGRTFSTARLGRIGVSRSRNSHLISFLGILL